MIDPVAASKFFVVDSTADKLYGYDKFGAGIGSLGLAVGDTESRGITGDATGTTLWVLDKNKSVYVSNSSGVAQGTWTASDLSTSPEGIAKDGTGLWMVDSANKTVYWYKGAASNLAGVDTAEFKLALNSAVVPKGLTTDGKTLWVVSDSSANTVFVYSITKNGAGDVTGLTATGSWTLDKLNATPTGITMDPTGVSKSLWVVDSATDSVYEYANGTTLLTGKDVFALSTFKLASGNALPQDIFDPVFTSASASGASAQTVDWLLQGLSSLPVDPYAEMSNLDWMSVTGQSDGVQLIGAGLVHHGDYVVAMV